MPRLNEVWLKGLVSGPTSVKSDKEGNIVQVAVGICVIHGRYNYKDAVLAKSVVGLEIEGKGFDTLWVITKDPIIMQEMLKCLPYDLITVKGMFRVQNLNKKFFCESCHEPQIYPTKRNSIYPIYFSIDRSFYKERRIDPRGKIPPDQQKEIEHEAMLLLKSKVEVSNIVKLTGAICKDPRYYETAKTKIHMLSFPLAVKRKYFIPEDDMRTNVDFPMIKFYGQEADNQYENLSRGNLVEIEGYASSRNISRKIACSHCGATFVVNETISEIVPYSIEYLREDITKPPVRFSKERRIAQRVGSEADIDIINVTQEQIADDASAAGYRPDPGDMDILSKVADMNAD